MRVRGDERVRPLPPGPCPHPPGSAERVETLRWRHENGYLLWHPLDAVEDPRPNGEGDPEASRGNWFPRSPRVYHDPFSDD
jgi:hypothetical protein